MKIALFSDIHLEIADWRFESIDADVIILAGDIAQGSAGITWAEKTILNRVPNKIVIYVAGNHEYYDSHLGLLRKFQNTENRHPNLHYLENQVFTHRDGVRFLGTTLWSDFSLYGAEAIESSMAAASRYLMDFRAIQTEDRSLLLPSNLPVFFQKAVRWLEQELAKPFDGKTVVITHFAPHRDCIAPQYKGDLLTPYFVSDLSWLIEKYPIDAWCFGHTHHNVDFIAKGGCRVVSNQVGYPTERFKNGHNFRSDFFIEL